MCRFNYRTMKHACAEPDRLSVVAEIDNEYEDIGFIDNWWIRLKYRITEMLPVIRREVFEKSLNLRRINAGFTIDYDWIYETIEANQTLEDEILDIQDEYDMCTRMYLTKMLVAFNEIDGENYSDFVEAVNDFIQHEYDNVVSE